MLNGNTIENNQYNNTALPLTLCAAQSKNLLMTLLLSNSLRQILHSS